MKLHLDSMYIRLKGQKKKKRPASKRRNVMDADVDQELLRRSFENDPDMR